MTFYAQRGAEPFYRHPARLPIVVCGPVLRRVTRTSVTVWLVTKTQAEIELRLYQQPSATGTRVASQPHQTLPLGRHVHMAAVTLNLMENEALEPGRRYGYDLAITTTDDDGETRTRTFTTSIVALTGGEETITYGDDDLPSFVLPPKELAGLRLLHGSCRKPHGEGADLLVLADDVLRLTHTDVNERPQLLLLTGDQIYADDVSPILLRCLNDSLPIHLGWRETVPSPQLDLPFGIPSPPPFLMTNELVSDGPWLHTGGFRSLLEWTVTDIAELLEPARASRIAPPQRGKEVRVNARYGSDASDAHLVFLGEFVLMYLFCWSDVLWPRTEHGELRLPLYREAVPSFSLYGAYSEVNLTRDRDRVATFAGGLGKVRRALANVATYMIFDDHEVTDDWNLNKDWVKRVNSSPMGPRLLRNALVAYALCQDWGSQPEHYLGGTDGRKILDAVTYRGNDFSTPDWPEGHDPPAPVAVQQAPALMENPARLDQILGIGAHHETPKMVWDHVIEPHGEEPNREYRIVVLDTRTRRDFPGQTDVDRAVSEIKLLLRDFNPSAGLVLTAGLLTAEETQRQLADRIDPSLVNIVVSPAPVFGITMVESAQRAAVLRDDPEVWDNEPWTGNHAAFDRVVEQLKACTKGAVVLSGDVHYAFTNRVSYPGAPHATVQLCASSTRNQTTGTHLLGSADPRAEASQLAELDVESSELIHSLSQLNGTTAPDFLKTYLRFPTAFGREFIGVVAEAVRLKAQELQPVSAPQPGDTDDSILHNVPFYRWFDHTPFGGDPVQVALGLRDLNPFSLPGAVVWPTKLVLAVGLALGLHDFIDQEVRDSSLAFTVDGVVDDRPAAERRQPAAPLSALNADRAEVAADVLDIARELGRSIVGRNNLGHVRFVRAAATSVRHTLLWQVHDQAQEPHDWYMATVHEARVSG